MNSAMKSTGVMMTCLSNTSGGDTTCPNGEIGPSVVCTRAGTNIIEMPRIIPATRFSSRRRYHFRGVRFVTILHQSCNASSILDYGLEHLLRSELKGSIGFKPKNTHCTTSKKPCCDVPKGDRNLWVHYQERHKRSCKECRIK